MSSRARDVHIDRALIGWFALAALGQLYTAWDIRSAPELRVMKPGWLLVILFTGPVGAALYVLSCKEQLPGRMLTSLNRSGSRRSGRPERVAGRTETGLREG